MYTFGIMDWYYLTIFAAVILFYFLLNRVNKYEEKQIEKENLPKANKWMLNVLTIGVCVSIFILILIVLGIFE